MNIKKIVMSGVLVLGISHCQVWGGVAEYPKILPCDSDGISSNNKVDRKKICGLMLNLHYFPKNEKLSIHQTKNPCFFMDKDDWEYHKGKKVNDTTVEFDNPESLLVTLYAGVRPDFGHAMIFHSDGRITSKIDMDEKFHNRTNGREVVQILGKDKQCYLRPTVEEWKTIIPTKIKGKFRTSKTMTLYLK